MSIETVVGIAAGIVSAMGIAIGVLWRALQKSQDARIEASERHAKDLESIKEELKKRKGNSS